ncbi:MAG: hypothetical protein ACREOR_05760, partial [Candidatus Binatia bacterium]
VVVGPFNLSHAGRRALFDVCVEARTPEARQLIGKNPLARRLASRYYRLAKGRWRQNRRAAARQAIEQATRLRPGHVKYCFYQIYWGLAAG